MSNFASVLNKRADDIEAPVPIPVGRYIGVVAGPAEFKEIGKNQTPGAVLKIRLLQPMEDVDAEALAAAGGIPERTLNHTVWLSEDAEYRTKTFLTEDLGLEAGNKTLGELFSEVHGATVGVLIKHEPSQDQRQIFARIDRTFNPNA